MAIQGAAASYVLRNGVSFMPPATLSVWVTFPSALNATAATNYFFTVGQSDVATSCKLHYIGAAGNRQIGCNFQVNTWGTALDFTQGNILSMDTWHHVAITAAGNGAGSLGLLSMYFDGALINTLTPDGSHNSGFYTDLVHGFIALTTGDSTGAAQVAYAAYYNRVLTLAEIQSLANSANPTQADPRNVASANLVSFCLLNFASGSAPDAAPAAGGALYTVNGAAYTVVADPFVLPVPVTPSGPGAVVGNPPFQPPVFSTTIPATVPGGGWNWHAPPAGFVGPFEYSGQIPRNFAQYNGSGQSLLINAAKPKPPRNFSPAAAPPSMSRIP